MTVMAEEAVRTLSYREAINEALRLEMRRDPTVIIMGEDVTGAPHSEDESHLDAWGGVLGVTKGLVHEFGRQRVRDTPITESGFVGAGVGAAATGLRPVVELMFIGFMGVCLDQIVNQAAKIRYMFGGKARIPLVIRTMIGAGFRAAAQHSDSIYSTFVHFPGLKVVAPATPADAKGLLIAAIRDDDPVIFCEHKLLYDMKGPVPEGEYVIPLGQAEVKREGGDVTIVAISRMVLHALEAAERLAQQGISAEVIDLRSLSPLDEATVLQSVRKTGRLVVVDEDNPRCSVAGDIATLAATQALEFLNAPVKLVTPPHTPVPFSPALEDIYVPSPERIVAAARATLG
ncbi:alpha-ketoacid dehydrogenase subunit beta [Chloroflexus sp. MS-CIW-1]|uniref:alpha-ketoacid dehydrogenase subunit beta n=1 Tax=Chloroflexus sp. MS-CIW-1 TaxID=3055768 RepID=UPI002649B345|nr:alpha-ketoacid dehydrogenase subunit beta [Chloroflexus sp. MS-CIW-1]MDN5273250.1 alpha-ketoacid dehydrogenase subunit beta [Chloroflexus sp. MS-CIW-1]